ncbi:MAG: ABC transporter ATP-binding protein [Chloroflexota bacterium]|nr:ABC transporter ATP-binding protein [Chloroflexota bacterium]
MAVTHASVPPTPAPAPTADMRWLWGYVDRHRGSAFGANFSGLIGGVASSAEPFVIGVIIDHLQQRVNLSQILGDIALLIGLAVILMISFFGMRHFAGTIAYAVNFDIRRDLYDNLLKQDNGFYQHHAIGDLISRIHADTEHIWRLLAIGFTRTSSSLCNLIAVFVLLATINLPLTAVVFVVLAVSTSFQIRAGAALTPMFEQVQDQMGTLASLVQDSVSGIQTVKTFGREDSFRALYSTQSKEYRRRWLFFKRRNEPIGMLPNMISNLATAVVVLFGGILTVQGAMTLGNFAQFLLYLGWITQSLLALGIIYQRFQQTRGAISRITPLLRQTAIESRPDALRLTKPHGDIRFEGVGVKVDDRWLLRHIDLDIPAGTVVGVVGATGGGKTLLVSLLARVLDPDEGRVLIDGVDVRDLNLEDLRQAIAYVPQSTFLFSAPLRDNIRMGYGEATDDDLLRAATIARVSNDLPQLPNGMDTMVGEKGVMLSGGQKQRVAIARAIVRDPAILVLDDALSSVDTHTAADILNGLREVLVERTSVIIAHRIASVKDADRILVLEEGEIVQQGTHADLVTRDGYYARMAHRELERDDEPIESLLEPVPAISTSYTNGRRS